jgi:hypothetical protein
MVVRVGFDERENLKAVINVKTLAISLKNVGWPPELADENGGA